MSLLKRGFKAQCERRSTETRRAFGIPENGPLEAKKLAQNLNVQLKSADEIKGISGEDIRQLTQDDSDSWSAFTLRINDRHLIVYNQSQSKRRVNSVVMHELSHIMLGHKLEAAGTTEDGHLVPSNYDEVQEAEADWLGGTLLLPRPALLWIRRLGLSDAEAGEHFIVSSAMLKWLIRMTGVDYQLNNKRRNA